MINNIIFFGLAALGLIISGTYLVKSLEKISRFLRISEFTAAFIIMALATSVPELFVGISSAIQGNPNLSLGNIIGSNIIDLTLISGIFVILGRGIKLHARKVPKDSFVMLSSVILIAILYLIGNSISRIDGVILLFAFAFNSYRIMKKRERYGKVYKDKEISRKSIIISSFIFVVALLILFVSSRYAVKYAIQIAEDFVIPELFIGIFLLGVATTLPELVFGIRAVMMKHESMSIGDQTGAVFVHLTLIIGLVALISPISIPLTTVLIPGIFMFLAAFIFTAFVQSGKELDVREGLSLIFIYIAFIIIQFFVK